MNPVIDNVEFAALGDGRTQNERILEAFARRAGQWISMPRLARIGSGHGGWCMVHSRVADLRKQGHVIEHKNLFRHRRCLSFYRLIPGGNS